PAPPDPTGPRGRSCGSPARPAPRARCVRCAPAAGSAPAPRSSSASPSPADTQCLQDDTNTGRHNGLKEKACAYKNPSVDQPEPSNHAEPSRSGARICPLRAELGFSTDCGKATQGNE